jgi:hypothetical protein
MFHPDRFSRRSLLKGLSATALLPLLEADIARADCLPAGRKRLVVVHWGNGLGNPDAPYVTAGLQLPSYMSPLQPYTSDLLIPLGLYDRIYDSGFTATADQPEPGHAHAAAVAVDSPMPSIGGNVPPAMTQSLDYLIGSQLQQSIPSAYPVINLGVMFQHAPGNGSPAWESANVAAYPDDDPYHVFDQLFSGFQMTQVDPAAEQRRLLRTSVLDCVQKDIARFSKKLGTLDRQKIDGHLTAIREMEQRLTPPTNPTTGQCTAPTLPPVFDVRTSDNYDKTLTAQIDNGVAALAAGMSQVLTLHAHSNFGGHYVASWLGFAATGMQSGAGGDLNSHHGIAHAGGDPKLQIDKWFCQKLAYLVQKLKAVPEGGGTMFDNTVVLVTNNMDFEGGHTVMNLPCFLIGSAGGYFKTGQVLQTAFGDYSGLLVGVANAFGASTAGWAEANFTTELPGLRP